MNVNAAITANIEEPTKNDTKKNTSIKDGVVLNVEGLNHETYENSADNLANVHHVQFEIPEPKMNDETFEISTDDSENPHFLQFEMTKTKANNKDYEISTDDSLNPHYHQIEIPKPKINTGEVKENKEDITKNKNTDQKGLNRSTEPPNGNNKKIRIKAKRKTKVRKSVKYKLKKLYTNVSFVLLMISLAMFLFAKSIVFTHILPYAVSENISSSVRLLLVSILGCSALVGKLALGAIAQLPRVNPIVLYMIAIGLSGMTSFLIKIYQI